MRQHGRAACITFSLLLGFGSTVQTFALDFSRMSNDELSRLQEQLQELSPEERGQLFAEMERRLEAKQPVQEETPGTAKSAESRPVQPRGTLEPGPGPGSGSGSGNEPHVRQIHRYGEAPRAFGQPPPAYGQGSSSGIGRGIPRL